MTVKIIIEKRQSIGFPFTECRVLFADNGAQLERRIDSILANLKADGYIEVKLIDCFNLEYPDMFQHH